MTDITYIPTATGMVYLCAVLDLCGKMVLAYRIGGDMPSSLVMDTIRDACKKEKVADGLTLHSDQGPQYTSQAYFDLNQEYRIQPSMSGPGCPYDNAAMEIFFGTLKTECLYATGRFFLCLLNGDRSTETPCRFLILLPIRMLYLHIFQGSICR